MLNLWFINGIWFLHSCFTLYKNSEHPKISLKGTHLAELMEGNSAKGNTGRKLEKTKGMSIMVPKRRP